MKNYLQIIFWIVLIVQFSGCSKTTNIDLKNIKLPHIDIPYLTKYKVDASLPVIQNISYRASMDEIVLEWELPNSKKIVDYGIVGYRILRYNPTKKKYDVIKTIHDPVVNHYVDSNLKPNSIYVYRISCFTKDKHVSVASKPISVKTKYTLKPIRNLRAISDLPKKIKLYWKLYPQNKLIRYYAIIRSENGVTNWKEIDTVDNSLAVEYIDYSVKHGQRYYYKVIGYTFSGIPTPSSNVVSAHSKKLPLTPKITVPPTQNEPRKIKLVWFDPNKDRKIDHYNIYTSVFRDTLYTKHAESKTKFFIDNVQKDGAVVYYKVTAVDMDGLESPMPKLPAKGMTKPNSSSPTITEYRLVDGRVIIKWIPPARDVRKYTVIKRYFNTYFIPKTLKITDIHNTTFVDKDIKLGKTYKYQVVGIDSDNIPTKPSREISIEIK
jgi:fibronectin type 3 domain-containing protein